MRYIFTKYFVKRLLCAVLCFMLLSNFTGCGNGEINDISEKKIQISICWPQPDSGVVYNNYEQWLKIYQKKFPNVEVVKDYYIFTTDSFLAKVASGTLPTLYNAPFTEAERLVSGNYVADISEEMQEYGYTEHLTDEIMDIITIDGKQYFIPVAVYIHGLYINNKLFKEAGLVDENGNILYPQTYEELARFAQQVRERTGKAGFILPTMNKIGGWHFMNIAWAFGTEFMKYEDNKWIATFGDEHGAAALQYVKDLKWKYNALSEDLNIDTGKALTMFSESEGAMYFSGTNKDSFLDFKNNYNMDKDIFSICSIPVGPYGRYSLLGGNINCIRPDATKEQKKAVFEWLKLIGSGTQLTDEYKENSEIYYKKMNEIGCAVGIPSYPLLKSGDLSDYDNEIREKYRNIPESRYINYLNRDDLQIHREEPVNCQELYEILDDCIQNVLRNENADCYQIMKNAEQEFQKNYLNVVE